MKLTSFVFATVLACLCVNTPVLAANAASDWGGSVGFQTSGEKAVLFNQAQQEYAIRNDLFGNKTYNSYNCSTADGCSTYYDYSTNQNGVTVVDVSGGDGNISIGTETSTSDTSQSNAGSDVVN